MIYYPLSTLMLAGIRDILVISTPQDTPRFEQLLGDGSQWGMNLQYAVQPSPDGLAQAFIIGESSSATRPSALVLGDNIFYGHDFHELLGNAMQRATAPACLPTTCTTPSATAWPSSMPRAKCCRLEEKPKAAQVNYAVTGLYFYDNQVCDIAKPSSPAPRGELEITDLNRLYLEQGQLNVEIMGRGYAWLDTGTHISCPEEIAYFNGWIDEAQLRELARPLAKNGYGQYLLGLLEHGRVE
jgi:glucose-1-phosphate thymidylyltransferase